MSEVQQADAEAYINSDIGKMQQLRLSASKFYNVFRVHQSLNATVAFCAWSCMICKDIDNLPCTAFRHFSQTACRNRKWNAQSYFGFRLKIVLKPYHEALAWAAACIAAEPPD